MMRYLQLGAVAASVLLSSLLAAGSAGAQTRVAPPAAVDSQPLAPPPGAAVPVQAPTTSPVPPQGVSPPGAPQPVQPPPALQGPVVPQPVQPAPVPQVPLEPQPVQPPPTLPAPTLPAPGQPLPVPPVTPQQQTEVPDPNATLAGKPGDASDVDPVLLVSKPVLMLSGQSNWDQGFQQLVQSFKVLRAEAGKAGLPIAGRPLTLFLETDDNGFRYEAMLPVGQAREGSRSSEFGQGVKPGLSPTGPSLRFLHNAPYDDVDSTYETITAYLEAKNIPVKDVFLEEYVTDLKDAGDPNLEINVYVQPR